VKEPDNYQRRILKLIKYEQLTEALYWPLSDIFEPRMIIKPKLATLGKLLKIAESHLDSFSQLGDKPCSMVIKISHVIKDIFLCFW
jgi:hypothetical protein